MESLDPEWGDDAFQIEADPLLRIGREEESPYQFALVSSGFLLDDGRMLVAEAGAQEVRLFDASGAHLMTLGARGEGPGEFTGLGPVIDYVGDSIAAFDGRLYRTTIFSLTSGAHRTIRNQVEGNYGVFGYVRKGPFLLYSPGRGFRPDLPPGPQWVTTDIIAMDPADGSSHVIATLPDRWRDVRPDGNAPMPQPLMHAVHAATSDGFYWATPDRYEIRLYDAEGMIRRIVRRPVEPRPVDASRVREYIELEVARVRRSRGEESVAAYRARLEQEAFGEYLPLFQDSFVDDEERLWVGVGEWPAYGASWRWSVFSRAGRWLGDVRSPEGVRIMDVRDSLVLGVRRDEFDVPHIQVHRLRQHPG